MDMRHSVRWLAAVAATAMAAVAVMASKSAPPPPPGGGQTLVVVARNYTLQAPESIPAGLTTIVVRNRGTEEHEAVLVRLDGGKTQADLLAAFATPGPDPAWVHAVGGPAAALPGDEASATLVLAPGHYVILCGVPAPNGKPHFTMGMVKALEVTPSSQPSSEPTPDVRISMVDFSYGMSGPVSAGLHTVRVSNDAQQGHMMLMVRFAPGKKMADMLAWSPGSSTPNPVVWSGGAGYMSPGGVEYLTMRFVPGDYGLICFANNPADSKAHFQLGMQKEFAVR